MNNLAEERKVLAFPDGSTLQEKEVVVADLENGYTRIANSIIETLCATRFSGRESQVFFAVVRKTFGFHQSTDWICLEQIVELTGIEKGNVSKTIKSLINRSILLKDGRKIGVNTVISG